MINKKDTTDMNILTDILKTVLTPLLEKYLAARKERKELERFYNTLIELSDQYIREHETEAVAHSEFADYVQRYNLYEHLFEFIESPQPISETEFINSQAEKAIFLSSFSNITIISKSSFILCLISIPELSSYS